MSAIDLETATNRLVGDASLTSDVPDEEAKLLLKWAMAQLPHMIEAHPKRDDFEAAFKQMRRYIRGVSHFVGEREYMAEPEQHEWLGKLAKAAAGMDQTVSAQQVERGAAQLPQQDNNALIHMLLGWVGPAGTAQAEPNAKKKPGKPLAIKGIRTKTRFTTYAFRKKG